MSSAGGTGAGCTRVPATAAGAAATAAARAAAIPVSRQARRRMVWVGFMTTSVVPVVTGEGGGARLPVPAPVGSAGAVASGPGGLDLDDPPGGVVHVGHGQPEPVPQAAQPFGAGPRDGLLQLPRVDEVGGAGAGALAVW